MKRFTILLLVLSLFCSLFVAGCAKKEEPKVTTALAVTTAPPETTEPPATTHPPETTGYVGTVYHQPKADRIVPEEITLDPAVYYITTPWCYPDTSSMTQEEKDQMVKDRAEQVAHMTTETLLDSVLQYPRLGNYLASSHISVLGYMAASGIPFLKDLLQREDLEWVMYNYPAEKLDSAEKDMVFSKIKAYVMGAEYLYDANIPPVSFSYRW